MDSRIETERLLLRACDPGDLLALHSLWTDPDVRRYLWDDEVIPLETAGAVIERSLASFAADGFGQWTVAERGARGLIGFCGLRFVEDGGDVEILYGFFPSFWGKGLATEAARAVLAYGFEKCGLERIIGRTDSPNLASARLLRRLGMGFEGEWLVSGRPTLHYLHSAARAATKLLR